MAEPGHADVGQVPLQVDQLFLAVDGGLHFVQRLAHSFEGILAERGHQSPGDPRLVEGLQDGGVV